MKRYLRNGERINPGRLLLMSNSSTRLLALSLGCTKLRHPGDLIARWTLHACWVLGWESTTHHELWHEKVEQDKMTQRLGLSFRSGWPARTQGQCTVPCQASGLSTAQCPSLATTTHFILPAFSWSMFAFLSLTRKLSNIPQNLTHSLSFISEIICKLLVSFNLLYRNKDFFYKPAEVSVGSISEEVYFINGYY